MEAANYSKSRVAKQYQLLVQVARTCSLYSFTPCFYDEAIALTACIAPCSQHCAWERMKLAGTQLLL